MKKYIICNLNLVYVSSVMDEVAWEPVTGNIRGSFRVLQFAVLLSVYIEYIRQTRPGLSNIFVLDLTHQKTYSYTFVGLPHFFQNCPMADTFRLRRKKAAPPVLTICMFCIIDLFF